MSNYLFTINPNHRNESTKQKVKDQLVFNSEIHPPVSIESREILKTVGKPVDIHSLQYTYLGELKLLLLCDYESRNIQIWSLSTKSLVDVIKCEEGKYFKQVSTWNNREVLYLRSDGDLFLNLIKNSDGEMKRLAQYYLGKKVHSFCRYDKRNVFHLNVQSFASALGRSLRVIFHIFDMDVERKVFSLNISETLFLKKVYSIKSSFMHKNQIYINPIFGDIVRVDVMNRRITDRFRTKKVYPYEYPQEMYCMEVMYSQAFSQELLICGGENCVMYVFDASEPFNDYKNQEVSRRSDNQQKRKQGQMSGCSVDKSYQDPKLVKIIRMKDQIHSMYLFNQRYLCVGEKYLSFFRLQIAHPRTQDLHQKTKIRIICTKLMEKNVFDNRATTPRDARINGIQCVGKEDGDGNSFCIATTASPGCNEIRIVSISNVYITGDDKYSSLDFKERMEFLIESLMDDEFEEKEKENYIKIQMYNSKKFFVSKSFLI